MRRYLFIGLLAVILLPLLLLLGAFAYLQTSMGRQQILGLLQRETASGPIKIEAQSIEGTIPFDMRLTGAKLSDAKGIWLEADELHLAWAPLQLAMRRVQIDDISIGHLALHRLPELPPSPPEPAAPKKEGPLLPSLPVDIDLRRLAVGQLDLGAPVIGEAASFTIDAQAKLGRPSDGLAATLKVQRTDRDNDHLTAELAYRPGDDFLKLQIAAHEPQGGLATHLMGLPNRPNLQVDAGGEGKLTDWRAQVTAKLDDRSLLALDLTTTGEPASRQISFTATADPAPFLPPKLIDLLQGGIKTAGQVQLDETSGLIRIDHLQVDSRAASIAAAGTVGTKQPGDLTLKITADDASVFAAFLPDITWKSAAVEARITGLIATPTTELSSTVADLAASGNRIATTNLHLTATPRGTLEQPIDVAAGLKLDGITPSDAKLASLTTAGADLSLTAALTASGAEAGAIDLSKLDLHFGTVKLDATGKATGWGAGTAGLTGHLDATDIAPLAALGGVKGKGAVQLQLEAANGPEGAKLTIDGKAADLSLGQAALDGLLGTSPTLAVDAERDATGRIELHKMTLAAKTLNLDASGSVVADKVDMTANLALSNLAAIDPRASGSLKLQAKAGGTMQAPTADVTITAPKIAYAQYVLTALNLTAQGQDLLAAPRVDLRTKASLNDLPTQINAKLAMQPDHGPISLNDLQAQLGGTSLRGQVTMTGNLAKGSVNLNSPDLAEIGRLIGQPLGGALTADVNLAPAVKQQNGRLTAKLEKFALGDQVKIAQTQVTATIADALGAGNLDARVAVSDVTVPQRHLDSVTLTAKGPLAQMTLTANAAGPETSLDLAALYRSDKSGQSIDLSRLNLAMQQEKLALTRPARIELRDGTTAIKSLVLASKDGSLALDASLGRDSNTVTLRLDKLPLSLARMADPSLHMAGTLDGNLNLSGPHSNPVAQLTLNANKISLRDVPMQPVTVKLTGDWRGGQVTSNGQVDLGGADNRLNLDLRLPLPAAPETGLPAVNPAAALQAQVKGKVDLALANAFLAGGADRLSGKAAIDIAANGPMNAPILSGGIDLQGGGYENAQYGVKIRDLQAKVKANGPQIDLVSLTARTPGGGSLSGSGKIALDGNRPITLSLKANQAQLVDTQMASVVTDADLGINGDLEHRIALTGTVKIRKAEIRIPDSLPPSVQTIPVVEANASPARKARIEASQQQPAKSLGIALDLTIDAPQQVSIRGRGLDAEMGGKLKITGSANKPIITGTLAMRRGTLDLLGRHLDFDRGQVIFDGGEVIDPLLDFEAKTKAETYDIIVTVSGSASAPKFALSSNPDLPQDEILARMLFGKAAGSLSPLEALQLAQAAASLAGVETGPGILDKLRQATGLDRLSVDTGQSDSSGKSSGPSLSAGRYVSEGVYVGVKQGAQPNSSAATVEIDVTPHIKVETDVGADAGSKVGVNMQWDY